MGAAASADTTRELSVTVGMSVLVDTTKPIERVAVGLGDYAEATAITPTEILVNGKATGETTMIIWERGGTRQFISITVRPVTVLAKDRLDTIRGELETELPGQPLKVSADGATIFLRGTVNDLGSSDRAVQIASTAGKVVNLLYVKVPPAEPQILLKVRFASVDRTKSKQLGINVFSSGFGNVIGTVSTGQNSATSVSTSNTVANISTATSGSPTLTAYFPGVGMGATIEALETKGIVQILAEPNLLAANGKQASFLAGGEYPFPVVQGGSTGTGPTVTIQFKEYGVRLTFIPTITPRGTIRLQVAPEVSSLDFTNAVEISGFQVPAVAERKVKTEVELGDGQSFALGGLLDNRETETFQKIPFLGDIPVLGKFFQSIARTKTNTELIVIVTPEIVSPIPVGAPLPALNYPQPFMEPNSKIPLHTPDGKAEGARPAYAPATMPVEQLILSQQPEKPLITGGTYGAQGDSGSSASPPK
jgi:pilus assembly protein CpaC